MKYLLILAIFLVSCGGNRPNEASIPTQLTTTPKGVILITTSNVSAENKTAIDESLTKVFADAKIDGYVNELEYTKYTIIAKDDCVRSPEQKIWGFKVRAQNYNNTEWDINPDPNIGEVYAAEQIRSYPDRSFYICNVDEATVRNTTRYGAEHIILYFNDKGKYQETETHLNGKGHPLITEY